MLNFQDYLTSGTWWSLNPSPPHFTKNRVFPNTPTLLQKNIYNEKSKENLKTLVIAEAGVNHNGDVEIAKELVRQARRCGADAVKFQTYKAERVVTVDAPKANYQLKTTDSSESQIEMLKKLEMPEEAYHEIIKCCQKHDIVFLSTLYCVPYVFYIYLQSLYDPVLSHHYPSPDPAIWGRARVALGR